MMWSLIKYFPPLACKAGIHIAWIHQISPINFTHLGLLLLSNPFSISHYIHGALAETSITPQVKLWLVKLQVSKTHIGVLPVDYPGHRKWVSPHPALCLSQDGGKLVRAPERANYRSSFDVWWSSTRWCTRDVQLLSYSWVGAVFFCKQWHKTATCLRYR